MNFRDRERETKTEDKIPLISAPLLDNENVFISHIAGTIEVDEKDRLKKLLFRATRGKALTFYEDFEVSSSTAAKPKCKSVYIVLFQEGRQLREKIIRICDSFMGQRFDLPEVDQIKVR